MISPDRQTPLPSAPSLLIVDDDPEMCALLTRLLLEQTGSVRAATTIEDAMDAIDAVVPDLAIIDWSLRNRDDRAVDAAPLIRHLAAIEEPHRPGILVLTGQSDRSLADRALALGADDFAVKPLDNNNLRARLGVLWNRVRTRRETFRREQRYQLAIRAARDAIWDWDVEADKFYLSRRYVEILRVNPSELTETISDWLDRIHPTERKRVEGEFNAYLAGLVGTFDIEHRLRTGSGTYKWMLCRGYAIRDAEGRPSRVVGAFTDLTERGMSDSLTNLPGRRALMDRLLTALRDWRRSPAEPFVVGFLDLDRFKWINDTLGHDTGDEFLRSMARRIESVLGDRGTLFRFGGDEFVVLLEHTTKADAVQLLEQIRQAAEQPILVNREPLTSTASIGVADATMQFSSTDDVIRAADAAMYLAKQRGGNRIEIYDAIQRGRAEQRASLAGDLHRAIEDDDFVAHFQPIVPTREGLRLEFETLIRWAHPTRGLIFPNTFIPIAEHSGQIQRLAAILFDKIFAALDEIRSRAPEAAGHVAFSVNVSPMLFADNRVATLIEERLQRHSITRGQLIIEITESAVITDPQAAHATLTRLKDLGCDIALDDFGTGFSSLSHLFSLPIDRIKIDRSFVSRMHEDENARKIITAMTQLGHSLGLKVVCEGAERTSQVDLLRSLPADFIQGFYYSRPLPLDMVIQLLQALPAHARWDAEQIRDLFSSYREDASGAARQTHRAASHWAGPPLTQARLEETASRLSDFVLHVTGEPLRFGDFAFQEPEMLVGELRSWIPLYGRYSGFLVLTAPRELLDSVAAIVYDHREIAPELLRDILGEFANILAGTATETLGLSDLSIGVPLHDTQWPEALLPASDWSPLAILPTYWKEHAFSIGLGLARESGLQPR